MADEIVDLVLLPHCDLHVALTGTPPLTLRVFRRTDKPGVVEPYTLTEVPRADCTYGFMAPYQDTGHRFDDVPTVDANGVVQPKAPGVFLFQLGVGDFYLVGRLQVHRQLENWWFGNNTLTTALDPAFGHALPTIYARFSDDNNATDLIGDISGHGYVTLTSENPRRVEITPHGRLRGLVETPQPQRPEDPPDFVPVSGRLGTFPERKLQVDVADYRKERFVLREHQLWQHSDVDEMQNILILAEGFEGSAADRAAFDEVAQKTKAQLFVQRRHEPYGILKERFNVFSAFQESYERGITCGNRVTDTLDPALPSGTLIPFEKTVGPVRPGTPPERRPYTMDQLVRRVGLPPRIDSRTTNPVQLWSGQQLHDFKPERVSAKLLKAWRTHRSLGILQARNSFFGVMMGYRPADRIIGPAEPVPVPGDDSVSADMAAFVKRVYEFWNTGSTGILTLDPRRHPPELFGPGRTSPLNSVLTYARGLGYVNQHLHVHGNIGHVWAPEGEGLRRSRALIAVVAYDYQGRPVNTNSRTLTLNTLEWAPKIFFQYDTTSDIDPAVMHRTVPAPDLGKFKPGHIVNVVAHEFGHTFNLGDEYEEFPDDGAGNEPGDLLHDNLTRLGHARLHAERRDINLGRVKWLTLPRMRYSARLLRASEPSGSPPGIKVQVDPGQLAVWRAVQKGGPRASKVSLRDFSITQYGQQLPLSGALLEGLDVEPVQGDSGVLVLTGQTGPAPVFGAGSVLYVPLRDSAGTPLTVVDGRVLTFLREHPDPLNSTFDHSVPNDDPDTPKRIDGLDANELRRTLVGIFEGGNHYAGAHYRPAGACKMRNGSRVGDAGSFCFVCMWLVVNRIDPSHHATISRRFYPGRGR